MTQLRQKMLEELQRRNYSHRTAKTYVRIVREFATYFHQPPDKLGPEQIRQYQAHLFQSKKLSPSTVSQYVSALRFLFVKTLRRHFLADYIPFPKSRKRLPTVLSPEEVAQLIDSARNLVHRTLLMTLYSTAMRRAELCRVKVRDIDSQRMMIRINQCKAAVTPRGPLEPQTARDPPCLLARESSSLSEYSMRLTSIRPSKSADRQRPKPERIVPPVVTRIGSATDECVSLASLNSSIAPTQPSSSNTRCNRSCCRKSTTGCPSGRLSVLGLKD